MCKTSGIHQALLQENKNNKITCCEKNPFIVVSEILTPSTHAEKNLKLMFWHFLNTNYFRHDDGSGEEVLLPLGRYRVTSYIWPCVSGTLWKMTCSVYTSTLVYTGPVKYNKVPENKTIFIWSGFILDQEQELWKGFNVNNCRSYLQVKSIRLRRKFAKHAFGPEERSPVGV